MDVSLDVKSTRATNTLDSMYEVSNRSSRKSLQRSFFPQKILAAIISQIDFMILHPVLSLMYEDR